MSAFNFQEKGMFLLKTLRSSWRSQNFRLLLAVSFSLAICGIPAFAQFTGGTSLVDPTTGAQSLAKFIVDGLLYIVASAAFVCFCWGIFRLFSRPLEGIMEICLGLIVFGLIGHALGWDAALTGQLIG
jgi:hypothetical protein